MSATFNQLLKRSAFVTHDPLITRVYASNARSINRYEDWGLKFPVQRAKGSRYIKVGALDAGRGIGAEWMSGEKETRFMAMWGDGAIPWAAKADRRRGPARASLQTAFAEEVYAPAPVPQMMPNVEAMTEAEFDKYLAHIRANRHELREAVYGESSSTAPNTPAEEATLSHASAHGLTRETTTAEFQIKLTSTEVAEPASSRIVPRPHPLHGLAYSSAPAGVTDRSRVHKGRVLDRMPRGGVRRASDGMNTDWVIGIGGLTAEGGSGTQRISDRATLAPFDYTRESADRGIADFRVNEATLIAPPRVLGLNTKASGGRRWLEHGYSSARRPGPLESFQFDIKVQEDDSAPADIGSRDWVARERAVSSAPSEARMGVLGAPKAKRVRGQGARAARSLDNAVHANTISDLLSRITKQA